MQAPHSHPENNALLGFPLPLLLLRGYGNFLIHPSNPGAAVHSGYNIHMGLTPLLNAWLILTIPSICNLATLLHFSP
jgi:hypothetical protein